MGTLVGTFEKYPPLTCWVKGGRIVSEPTMYSAWTHWVIDPLPPVPGDCRGVDAGFEDAGFEGAGFEEMVGAVLDGPLMEPSNRRSLSSPEPNGQATDDESLKTTYRRFCSTSCCILPSPYPKAHDQCIPQTFDPFRVFLQNQHCER